MGKRHASALGHVRNGCIWVCVVCIRGPKSNIAAAECATCLPVATSCNPPVKVFQSKCGGLFYQESTLFDIKVICT